MKLQLKKACVDVGLVSNDYPAAHRFYGETLGLEVLGQIPFKGVGTVYRYAIGESVLRIFVPDRPASPATDGESFSSRVGIRYLTLLVEDAAAVAERISAAGYRTEMPLREIRPGVKVVQVQDADCNTIELMSGA